MNTVHEKVIISTTSSHFSCSTKFTVKSKNWFECSLPFKPGVCLNCACAYAWAHNKYSQDILNFSTQFFFLKYYFIFTIKYTELDMIHFERIRLSFIKNNHTFFKTFDQILSASPKCLWLIKRPHMTIPFMALPIINICWYLIPFYMIVFNKFLPSETWSFWVGLFLWRNMIIFHKMLCWKFEVRQKYLSRRMYTHNAHPCFKWNIPSKSPILWELLNVKSGNIIGFFFFFHVFLDD